MKVITSYEMRRVHLLVLLIVMNYLLDVDECKEELACQCPNCKCKNTWGSYECSCKNHLLYIHEHDTCISKYIQIKEKLSEKSLSLIDQTSMIFLAIYPRLINFIGGSGNQRNYICR